MGASIEVMIDWSLDELKVSKARLKEADIVVSTPWSVVVRIELDAGVYYLKKTPKDIFLEAEAARLIKKIFPGANVVSVVAEKRDMYCFLMESAGDESLRDRFKGKFNEQEWLLGINSYTNIIRKMEPHIDSFLSHGIPDWRLNRLPKMYTDLLQNERFIKAEQINKGDLALFERGLKTLSKDIDNLKGSIIKESLINCDFNDKNVVYSEDTKTATIIDIGEVVVSHPFFTVASHIFNIATKYEIKDGQKYWEGACHKWLRMWEDVADFDAVLDEYRVIEKIAPIYCAFSTLRLYEATDYECLSDVSTGVGVLIKNYLNA